MSSRAGASVRSAIIHSPVVATRRPGGPDGARENRRSSPVTSVTRRFLPFASPTPRSSPRSIAFDAVFDLARRDPKRVIQKRVTGSPESVNRGDFAVRPRNDDDDDDDDGDADAAVGAGRRRSRRRHRRLLLFLRGAALKHGA
jgi:hypothetical protein